MVPTFIGFFLIAIGTYLLIGRSIEAMYSFVLMTTLMGGSSAASLVAAGGASIQPAYFGMGFLVLRLMLPSAGQWPALRQSVVSNTMLFVFVAWGIATAFTMPFIFKDQFNVVPLKPEGLNGIFGTAPLKFRSQNITASINMFATMLIAVVSYVAVRQPRGAVILVRTAIVITFIHVYLGVSAAVLEGTGYTQFIQLFRNGSYFQHNQGAGGFIRIAGIFPETSGYSAYGFVLFVFMAECWLRGIVARWTGLAAAAMAATLAFSTASTAYVSLGGYAVLLVLRVIVFPSTIRLSKLFILVGVGMAISVVVATLLLVRPSSVEVFTDVVRAMTVEKADSSSGLQRAFWARQGIDLFVETSGLGVGAGSFRSSSLFTAILGSTGMIGSVAFVLYMMHIHKPLRAGTYLPVGSAVDAVGVAASWTALMSLIPMGIGWASPDPGETFGLIAGAALGLRARARRTMVPPVALSLPPPRLPAPTPFSTA